MISRIIFYGIAKKYQIKEEQKVPENPHRADLDIRWYIFGSAIKIAMKNGAVSNEVYIELSRRKGKRSFSEVIKSATEH